MTFPSSRISRLVLLLSVAVGIAAIIWVPPNFYFRSDRLLSGLPQPYFGFDPDRYLAGVPQRSRGTILAIIAAKFIGGVLATWIPYFSAIYVFRGSKIEATKSP